MSFFDYANQKQSGRKRGFTKADTKKGGKKFKKRKDKNDDIDSSEEELAEERSKNVEEEYESEEEEETAQEKQLRLAKKYLQEIEEEEKDRVEFETDAVTKRLQEEYSEEKGKLRKFIANNYTGHEDPIILSRKPHRDSVTCICLSHDGNFLYSGSKDGTLVKWDFKSKTKVKMIRSYKDNKQMKSIHCIAVSTDGSFVCIGEQSTKDIVVLSANLDHVKNLQGHRDIVTGLVFRKDTHTLYSASSDRSVKVWNLDEMAYVETFFGHQSGITSIDALSRERAITSGGFDKSIRVWKIVEESQLLFHGNEGNIDSVKLMNEDHFLSCGDDGQLNLWGTLKKKPLFTVNKAHGIDENGLPLWISSIAALINTDLVASASLTGSNNGKIIVWKCGNTFRSLEILFEIELPGFINALQFTPDGNFLIAGVGQEHRLGRWSRLPKAKNCIAVIPLKHNSAKRK